jgi:hypothetical protein
MAFAASSDPPMNDKKPHRLRGTDAIGSGCDQYGAEVERNETEAAAERVSSHVGFYDEEQQKRQAKPTGY